MIKDRGFTLIEVLIAMVILSVGLLGMASTTISVIRGNQVSDHVTGATVLAQDMIETLRNQQFYLGPDGALGGTASDDSGPDAAWGTSDDYISYNFLLDPDCAPDYDIATGYDSCANNDISTDVNADANLFAQADRWDGWNTPVSRPVLNNTLQRVWNITDNVPLPGMKTVTIIVGWQEVGRARYVAMLTVIAGTRYANMPGTI